MSEERSTGMNGWQDSDSVNSSPGDTDWQDTVHLLRLVQDDYTGARRQLEQVSQTLAEREALVNERLQYAMLSSSGQRTMCLVPYTIGAAGSLLGTAVLGAIPRPRPLPRRPDLSVHCLGRFELSCGGDSITKWQSARSKAVFQYLMTRPRQPVVKDILMEALWPGSDLPSANNNLKAAIHGLRLVLGRLLGEEGKNAHILFVQGSYSLNPDIDLWVDVEEFERHWAEGRRFEREGHLAEAVSEFEAGESLYRGDYLQDELYEDWTMLRREALRDTYMSIVSKLAGCSLESGDYESCIAHCQKILVKDQCREDAYRWLMRSYSRLGQRNRALRWYEICRRTVNAGLDTDPDPETTSLYNQLLNNEPI